MKGWEGKSLPTGCYVSYFPNVSIMRRLVSACWASCSARAISRTSRNKWKVRSREIGDSSDLFSTCSSLASMRRCASLNRACLTSTVGVESGAVVPPLPNRKENSSPRCSSRGRRTVGESTARQSAGGRRKVASRAAHINTFSFMSPGSCKQNQNKLSAISIEPVSQCPVVARCLAPPLHFSSEPITDILCSPFITFLHCYSNICVSSDTWSHEAQKHSHRSKKPNSKFCRKTGRQKDSLYLKCSTVNLLRLAFLSTRPQDFLVKIKFLHSADSPVVLQFPLFLHLWYVAPLGLYHRPQGGRGTAHTHLAATVGRWLLLKRMIKMLILVKVKMMLMVLITFSISSCLPSG